MGKLTLTIELDNASDLKPIAYVDELSFIAWELKHNFVNNFRRRMESENADPYEIVREIVLDLVEDLPEKIGG